MKELSFEMMEEVQGGGWRNGWCAVAFVGYGLAIGGLAVATGGVALAIAGASYAVGTASVVGACT
jgi:hypothetical protein